MLELKKVLREELKDEVEEVLENHYERHKFPHEKANISHTEWNDYQEVDGRKTFSILDVNEESVEDIREDISDLAVDTDIGIVTEYDIEKEVAYFDEKGEQIPNDEISSEDDYDRKIISLNITDIDFHA